ncbi:small conductance mechanosensitive channel [Streptoalloteichus tenebrarius]|uniref:Small conductance mechanosensitive channel n=1 Tax=Streptoalloteichus tenebrarius (strain ATCC 17920 / DSM 40477 / JCM 4838 / CBS 697.72 / NBRC 16177 / NCIMB 11028 / NRRL B-12390 / A12253. 1 / ISP 5477) TaxID=1933 RepID=A0ABT1HW54_STRSD|nr:small conductance mechanosensitive channel [Streptoalloteichus tenebrarius]BFF00714.1 mechanosensitive ion channel [Streptoalloteichus tenebrarius]
MPTDQIDVPNVDLNGVTKAAQDPEKVVSYLAANLPGLIMNAGQIVLIIVIAFLVRYLIHRLINRLTSGRSDGKAPLLLAPLKERATEGLGPLLSERRAQRVRTIGSVLKSLTSFLVLGMAALMVLDKLGIPLAPILASVSVAGIALGFGAQNLIKDFLSGMFMMMEDQYGVGDVVDLGPATGTVEAVGLRVTTVRDVNGTVWYVRNGEILRVGNSSQGYAVAVVDLPVSHSTNVGRATELAGAAAAEATGQAPLSEDVLEPVEVLGVEKVTAESITLRLTVKVRPGRQWAVQRALRARIKAAFDEAGFEPPIAVTRGG